MELFNELEILSLEIDNELRKDAEREGLPKCELTTKIFMDSRHEALWFEVVDVENRVLSYVSLDFPHLTASGEKLVGVADESEIYTFGDED